MSEEERELGPGMKAEGWLVIGGDDIMWMHRPSQRCITMHPAPRRQCLVPCWGPEPEDPDAQGYFVACRFHDEDGNPLYGDAVWTTSYVTALKLARRIRSDILAETPTQAKARKRETERRQGDWLIDVFHGK